ncbi:MAG: beta-propeller fold lactonase family protein [Calditrichaeota bacterium]|nr:beta-propeller fold lactonase family protein [Calditrichota bacterium]
MKNLSYLISILFICAINALYAANDFIYTVLSPQAEADTNYIAQYKIVGEDSLQWVASTSTGGTGRANTANSEIVIDKNNLLLFSTNAESHDISVFNILPDGLIEPVDGSPFKSHYDNPASLALHPNGKFLYVGHSVGLSRFTVSENGNMELADTVSTVFFPRGMAISPAGDFIYIADLAGGVHALSINQETGALSALESSPFTYEPMQRTNKIYLNQDGTTLYVLDIDKGTFGFTVLEDGSLEGIPPGLLIDKSNLGCTAGYSNDSQYFYIARKGWIYVYKNSGEPPLSIISAKSVQSAGISYFSQLVNHPTTNVLYSFTQKYLYMHKPDQTGNLTELKPYTTIPSLEGYVSTGAAIGLDVATSLKTENRSGELGSFRLYQNFPNPFNPETTIKYNLTKSGKVTLSLYNLLGQNILEMVNEYKPAGSHSYILNGSNLTSGTYFYKIETEDYVSVRKLILIK